LTSRMKPVDGLVGCKIDGCNTAVWFKSGHGSMQHHLRDAKNTKHEGFIAKLIEEFPVCDSVLNRSNMIFLEECFVNLSKVRIHSMKNIF
jgi:hypothetical protein